MGDAAPSASEISNDLGDGRRCLRADNYREGTSSPQTLLRNGSTLPNTVRQGDGLLLVGILTFDSVTERYGLVLTEHHSSTAETRRGRQRHPLGEVDTLVLAMVASGAGNKQIARALSASHSYAARQVRKTLQKLGVRSRAAAVVCAAREGWLEQPSDVRQ
ncbi:MAG: LuxR C-terminal-related transcriptional regulator [Chloroflexi bacterium]|nr:LuxR C-terminal-related transcriptional regulator [Chloroflexota bacterium]MDA8189726.1 LuxR C-terminal-related transcriptional regulator [Dehalococcoidales bacterium]